MRTPEQIKNLRTVLILTVGPFGVIASDEYINDWADRVQKKLDEKFCSWELQIKTMGKIPIEWKDIPKEPPTPKCSIEDMSAACWNLLIKYPSINSIRIDDVETHTRQKFFSRD